MEAKHDTSSAGNMAKKAGAIGVILWLAAPGFAQAQAVIPRDSVAFGRTYSGWAAAWWQWALSIPATSHPLFDTTMDCSVGQSGPVFFLGGKFCATNATNCTPGRAVRTCTVKADKALFFPVVNVEDSTLEETRPSSKSGFCTSTQPNPTINCLRLFTQSIIDVATDLAVTLDGQSIPISKSNFREQSTAFDFTLPPRNNLFNAIGEGPFNGGTYSLGVDDGVYVMLAPLSVGAHSLNFTGTFQFPNNNNVTISSAYTLNVTPP